MATPTGDPFGGVKVDLEDPIFSGAYSITPGTALPFPTRAIWVGGAGNIGITDVYGNTVTLTGAVVGTYIPIRVSAVSSTTTTTATNLIGLF